MSYGGYGQGGYGQQANPYGSQTNSYGGGQANPYAQQNPYSAAPQQSYSQQSFSGRQPQQPQNPQRPPQYSNHQSQYSQPGQDLEMNQLGGQPGFDDNYAHQNSQAQQRSANLFEEARKVSEGVDRIEQTFRKLEAAQRRALGDTVTDRSNPTIREIESLNADIMAQYRTLIDKMKRIKSTPGAGSSINQKHIDVADRKLQDSRQRFIMVQSDYEKRVRDQTARQYKLAQPGASEDEVRQAVEDPNQQVFVQALLNRDRRGEARQVLGAVRDRHEAIQRIERQLGELAELFNEMERLVVEQEPLVEQVEQQAVETQDNLTKANTELVSANKSARAARKKQYICIGIGVLIVIVIAVIIVIILAATGTFKSKN